jgi:hypothetical protein
MAAPMSHPIYRVLGFEILTPYTLRVAFDDTTEQVIDFEPLLRGELYGPLRDRSLFDRVVVDSDAHTLVWPNGADFDPATLHDWPHCKTAFLEMVSHWDLVRA